MGDRPAGLDKRWLREQRDGPSMGLTLRVAISLLYGALASAR